MTSNTFTVKGAMIVDGSGKDGFRGDVVIEEGRYNGMVPKENGFLSEILLGRLLMATNLYFRRDL